MTDSAEVLKRLTDILAYHGEERINLFANTLKEAAAHIEQLERRLAAYEKELPDTISGPIFHGISYVAKDDYDSLARAYARMKVELSEALADLASAEIEIQQFKSDNSQFGMGA